MEKVVFAAVIIGFLYVLYSLVSTVVKVKKAGKDKCHFRMPVSKMFFRGVGILLVASAALAYRRMGNQGWLPFLCLTIIFIVDFINESIEIKEK